MPDKQPKKPQQSPQPQLEEQPESSTGPVPIEITPQKREQAQKFFERAQEIAASGDPDYAVQMYLEGLLRDPDSLKAHQLCSSSPLEDRPPGARRPVWSLL